MPNLYCAFDILSNIFEKQSSDPDHAKIYTVPSTCFPTCLKNKTECRPFFFVLCLRFSRQKYVKKKTKLCFCFSTVPQVFSPKMCKKSKRNARIFSPENNSRHIFCTVSSAFPMQAVFFVRCLPPIKYVKKKTNCWPFF